MQIGIIGLPLSGKTTIFNALTRGHAQPAAYSSGKLEVHTAIVDVPDPRLDALTRMFKPRKQVHAQVQYNDIAGLARGIGEKGALDGNLLNQIAQNDALLLVIRAFDDPNVPRIEETIDPARDLETLSTELILSDLGIVERRIERLHAALLKGGGTPEEVYEQPQNKFVAEFIGLSDFLPVRIETIDGKFAQVVVGQTRLRASGAAGFAPNQTALLFIRPNDIEIAAEGAHENVLEGVVKQATYLGEQMDYRVEASDQIELRVQTGAAHRFAKGARVRLYLPAERLRVIGEE
jgi:hypothetical protein